jgi:hypothetical protein
MRDPVDKKALSERDICTKFITPAIVKGGWDLQVQVRLRDTNKPMGIAEYQLAEALPKDLEANLPSIEQIERELGDVDV